MHLYTVYILNYITVTQYIHRTTVHENASCISWCACRAKMSSMDECEYGVGNVNVMLTAARTVWLATTYRTPIAVEFAFALLMLCHFVFVHSVVVRAELVGGATRVDLYMCCAHVPRPLTLRLRRRQAR